MLDFSKTNKWDQMMEDLKLNASEKKKFTEIFMVFEPEISVNNKSLDDFLESIHKEIGIDFWKNYSMLDDFIDRFEVNKTIHPIMREVSKKYKIWLLTNMYPNMLEEIEKRWILPEIDWDVIIDSSIEWLRKPQKEIYKLAERRANCQWWEILFIDNLQENLETAKKLGWKTLLYDPLNVVNSNQKLREIAL